MYNQPNNQLQVISKPKTLCLLFVFIILQFCLVVASLILQGVMGYIGFQNSSSKISISSNCTDLYSVLKFSTLLQYPMSIAFVFSCAACLFSLIMFVLVLKPLIGQHLVDQKMNPSHNKERTELNLLQIFISMKISTAWYIVQSLDVICVGMVFGYFLTYYIQAISSVRQCNFTVDSNQILTITIVSGIALIFGLINWIIIFCIRVNLNKILKSLAIIATVYEVKSTKEVEMQKISDKKSDKKSEKVSDKKSEQGKIQTLEKEELDSGRNLKPKPFVAKEIKEPFLEENGSHYGSHKKQQSQHEQQQKNQYRKSIIRKNPTYLSRKDIYESPYSRIQAKPFYQPESPKYQREENLQRRERQFKYKNSQTQSKVKLREEQDSYIDRSSKRMIPQGGLYEGHRNRLHSTYFREDNSIGKSKYKKSPGRGGILTEYIHGRYVQQ